MYTMPHAYQCSHGSGQIQYQFRERALQGAETGADRKQEFSSSACGIHREAEATSGSQPGMMKDFQRAMDEAQQQASATTLICI